MNNIYIGGDSFCFDRSRFLTPNVMSKGWPQLLADNLNLNLTGQGFPGRGFWRTRLNLIQYIQDRSNFKNTKLFVFCHTGPDRMIHPEYAKALARTDANGATIHINSTPYNNNEITETYYKYLYDQTVHNWAMERWFIELNELLAGPIVINLFCFESSENLSQRLNGYKLNGNLYGRAKVDGIDTENDVFAERRLNHFSMDYNIRFANALANYYTNEILPNPMQTKYFDIDI